MHGQTVVTWGELLLRLDAPPPQRLVQSAEFQATYTGGEANVAVALAGWGLPTRIVSRVPDHAIGDACVNHFRRYGADVSQIVRGGQRLGILFVETGVAQRPPQVIYDREHSAFRDLASSDLDWDAIFADAGWFHFTGTAPAVSQTARDSLRAALKQARDRNVRVSFDCSYRSALWTVAEAAAVLPSLLEFVDVFFGSESDTQQFFGIQQTGTAGRRQFRERYGLQVIAFTERSTRPDGVQAYAATIDNGTQTCTSRTHELSVVDRIGAGDAFAAGIIRGLIMGRDLQATTEFATAAAVLKHTVPGDFALVTIPEVERLAAGEQSARGWR